MSDFETIGFIGVGVMGEPMCRNLAQKGDLPVVANDPNPEPLDRLGAAGVEALPSAADVAARADLVFLSLPSGAEVSAVAESLLANPRAGQVVVDTSTTPVKLTRDLAARFREAGIAFADAPIARTRAAAEAGTLSVMVGADRALFDRIEPFIRCYASDITLCGDVGAGQVVKIMNNMVLFQTVVALSEALAVGRRAGVDGERLFDTLTKGSADSFALRNHGMKALLPGEFPLHAFSTRYALKDLACALELAEDVGLKLQGAELARALLTETVEQGHGDEYFPAVITTIER